MLNNQEQETLVGEQNEMFVCLKCGTNSLKEDQWVLPDLCSYCAEGNPLDWLEQVRKLKGGDGNEPQERREEETVRKVDTLE